MKLEALIICGLFILFIGCTGCSDADIMKNGCESEGGFYTFQVLGRGIREHKCEIRNATHKSICTSHTINQWDCEPVMQYYGLPEVVEDLK